MWCGRWTEEGRSIYIAFTHPAEGRGPGGGDQEGEREHLSLSVSWIEDIMLQGQGQSLYGSVLYRYKSFCNLMATALV